MGLANTDLSVLDVGCRTRHYAKITRGVYVGIDRDPRCIEYASKCYRQSRHTFRCMDVAKMWEGPQFDVVLIVDTLHHLGEAECKGLLTTVASLAQYRIVSFVPIAEQHGPVGRWIIRHDRGEHMRSLADLHALFDDTGIAVMKSDEIRLGPIATRAILGVPEQVEDRKRKDSDVEMHNE